MDDILEQIREFADNAHGDQQRKYSPERYIEHPVRVMEICEDYVHSLPVLAAALLHDVLEDTDVSKDEMHQFLLSIMTEKDAYSTLQLVVELTDVYTKARHPRLNRQERKAKEAERISAISADAQTIKYADILDNCKEISGQDSDFAPVFLKECRMLMEKMKRGHPELFKKVMQVLDHESQQLSKR